MEYTLKTDFLKLNLLLTMECKNYKDTSHLSALYILNYIMSLLNGKDV